MPMQRASLFHLTVFLSQLSGLRLASYFVSPGPGHPSDHSEYVLEDEEDFPVRHLVGANFDEDNVTLALHHKNGQSIVAILEEEGDCIYNGYMMGCPTSTALVTGCKGEMQGVQIQSKVFGDMIFDLQDGVVMPLTKRYKRALDPDIDYDYDDSSDFGVLEEFADLDNAEAADLPPPPPKLVLNLNVYMDKEWSAEFGRNGRSKAKKILTQAKLLWAHDSLSTKVDFLFEDDKFNVSTKHLLVNRDNLKELPSLLDGPDKTPSGEKMAHIYFTVKKPKEKTYTHGLAVEYGMCSSREKPRVMVLYHNSELRTAMTVAHEIGHIVGMEHDFVLGGRNHKCVSGGKDGDTVMAYGDARQKFSACSNEDFKLYYNRVVSEKLEFCLQPQSTDCSCNGKPHPVLGTGGKCTLGGKGLWCFVNQNTACKTEKQYGKFISFDPCKPKPCACSGETDIIGLGLCGAGAGAWCYVAEEASCADVQPYGGKFLSRAACGTQRTTKPPPTQRTTRRTTRPPPTQRTTRRTTRPPPTRRTTRQTTQNSAADLLYLDSTMIVELPSFTPFTSCPVERYPLPVIGPVTAVLDEKILVCGGRAVDVDATHFACYSLTGRSWKREAGMREGRYRAASSIWPGHGPLVTGGSNDYYLYSTEYLSSSGQWTPGPVLPVGMHYHCQVTAGSDVIITGGREYNNRGYNNLASAYKLSTDGSRWTTLPSMATARWGHACVVHQGYLFVIGGRGAYTSVEVMKLTSLVTKWETGPGLDTDFSYGQAIVYQDTLFLVYKEGKVVKLNTEYKWEEVTNLGNIGKRPVFPAPMVTPGAIGC